MTILSKDTHETVIRIAPPLTIDADHIDWPAEVFDKVLESLINSTTSHSSLSESLIL